MKILCILYDDPKTGMPDQYARDDLPKLEKYPDGMTLPSPKNRFPARRASWLCFG
jgi:formate dehydrogenase